jgi:membrane protease subunit HflC
VKSGLLLALLLIVAVVMSAATYVVDERDQVIITQFGDPVGEPVTEAGLHFKLPFVQAVNRFEKRVLEWDGEKNQIPTADKRYIWLDTTARWRIEDPLKFLQAVGTENGAQTRLDDILDSAARNQISRHALVEVVRLSNRVLELPRSEEDEMVSAEYAESVETGRDGIALAILEEAQATAPGYGIELLDVRIKRINYVESVRTTVYQRMISERHRIAERFRSEGQGVKSEITGRRQRELKTIESEAYRQAQEIIAKADADAARIYADAYEQDPEFYAFVKTLETYKDVVGPNHTLVISPKSDLYRYLTGASKPR